MNNLKNEIMEYAENTNYNDYIPFKGEEYLHPRRPITRPKLVVKIVDTHLDFKGEYDPKGTLAKVTHDGREFLIPMYYFRYENRVGAVCSLITK